MSWILRVSFTNREVHRFTIGCKGARTFILCRVDFAFHRFDRLPFTFFVFLQVKNIAILHGCNTAYVTLCLLTCGGEIKLLCIRTQISRTIVRTCAVKECTGLHCISASLRLDGWCAGCSQQPTLCCSGCRKRVKTLFVYLSCSLIVALSAKQIACRAQHFFAQLLIANSITVSTECTGCQPITSVGVTHFHTNLSTLLALRCRYLSVGFLIQSCCLCIFTYIHGCVSAFYGFVSRTT